MGAGLTGSEGCTPFPAPLHCAADCLRFPWRCAAAPARPRGLSRAVGPAGRLRCDARVGVAPPNSRRSLRSLCSDNGGESVYEAR